jgi:hypothetical protein
MKNKIKPKKILKKRKIKIDDNKIDNSYNKAVIKIEHTR